MSNIFKIRVHHIWPNSSEMQSDKSSGDGIKRQSKDSIGCCRPNNHLEVGKYKQQTELNISGVSVIANGRSWWVRRLLWLALLVTSSVLLFFQLSTFWARFLSENVERKYEQVHEKHRQLPSLTFCHNNKFKKSVVLAMSVTNTSMEDWLDAPDFSLLDWNRFKLEDLISRGSYTPRDMISHCLIGTENCFDVGEFTPTSFSQVSGQCYTYSSSVLVVETLSTDQVSFILKETEDVSYFEHKGWTVALHHNTVPFDDLTLSAGVASTITVPPNGSIQIKVTKLDYRHFPLELENGMLSCKHQSPVKTLMCVNECMKKNINYTADDCQLPWYSRYPGQKPCSSYQDYLNATTHVDSSHMKKPISAYAETSKCGCSMTCNVVTYWLSTPYRQTFEELLQLRVVSRAMVADGTQGRLSLWFSSVTEQVTDLRPYGWSQFSSDLGGSLGLMLGGSLLTVVELLDLSLVFAINLLPLWMKKTTDARRKLFNIFGKSQK